MQIKVTDINDPVAYVIVEVDQATPETIWKAILEKWKQPSDYPGYAARHIEHGWCFCEGVQHDQSERFRTSISG